MIPRAPRPARPHPDAGFTLLETLVALAVLGLLTVFLLQGLRIGSRYLQTATSRAEPANAIGTVQDLLRRMLEETYPALSYGDAGPQPVFDGRPDRLTFTTMIPPQLGRDGYYRVDLVLSGGHLQIRWQPERGQSVAFQGDDARGPYNLLDHVATLRLQYFGATSPQDSPGWTDHWRSFSRSPTLLRMDVGFTKDQVVAWPSLVVSPRVDVDITCAYDPLTHRCQGR